MHDSALFFFLFLFRLSLDLLFGLSEDDAYVDKLPTFERHFDSFAGIVQFHSERKGDTLWHMKHHLNHYLINR